MAQTEGAAGDGYKWRAFWVIAPALFITVMDFSGTGVALPSIADDFALWLRDVSWVTIAASLTITAFLLPMGRVADLAGRKAVHLAGLALFAGGALLAALSVGLPMLIGARVVMATGLAMGQGVMTAMIASVFPPRERGRGLGMLTATVGAASSVGPIAAGFLVGTFGWRSVFVCFAVLASVALVLGAAVLDDARVGGRRRGAGERYDWVGAVISAAALALAIYTINNPRELAWTGWPVVGGGAIAAAFLAAFVWWELRVRSPMIDLRFFRSARFSWASSARYLGFVGNSAVWFLVPFYLQNVQGYEPRAMGFVIFAGAFGMAVTGMFSGFLSDRFGFRVFTVAGLGLSIAAGLAFASLRPASPLYAVVAALLMNGVGQGLWMAPNMSATLGAVERSDYGIVGAFLNLVRNAGTVTGVALTTVIVTAVMVGRGFTGDLGGVAEGGDGGAAGAFVAGMRAAFLVLVCFSAVALLAAIMARDSPRSERAA
ncbi:MAG: MFS transporter [Gemmatimonadetes bacterium]|nr:MFS transporter [Gemmatimonadota bacterium]